MTAAAGLAARDQGFADVQAADCAVIRDYGKYYDRAIDILARSGGTFTADDVRRLAGQLAPSGARPHSDNLIGSHFGTARRQGRIRRVWAEVTSTRASRNAAGIKVWIGAEHTTT